MATLNDVISCYNELVDEVNGHTASIDALTASLASINTDDIVKRIDAKTDLQTFTTAMATLTAKLETRLAQVEARLDELVKEHDVMMDAISSLLSAPTQTVVEEPTVELKRVGKKGEEAPTQTVEEEAPTPALKRVGKKTVVEEAPEPTVAVEEAPAPKPTVVEEEEKTEEQPTPAPTEVVAALKRASAPSTKTVAPKPAPKTTVTEIQKRAFARQYMVEHGAKVEDLRNPEKINETIASEEFTAWMGINAR